MNIVNETVGHATAICSTMSSLKACFFLFVLFVTRGLRAFKYGLKLSMSGALQYVKLMLSYHASLVLWKPSEWRIQMTLGSKKGCKGGRGCYMYKVLHSTERGRFYFKVYTENFLHVNDLCAGLRFCFEHFMALHRNRTTNQLFHSVPIVTFTFGMRARTYLRGQLLFNWHWIITDENGSNYM